MIFLALLTITSRRNASASGFALSHSDLILRLGHYSQHTIVLPRSQIQSVTLSQSPFDLRNDMANIRVDISGGRPGEFPAPVIHYLRVVDALMLERALRRIEAVR